MAFRWVFEKPAKIQGYTEIKDSTDNKVEEQKQEQMSLDYPLINWVTENALGITANFFLFFRRCKQQRHHDESILDGDEPHPDKRMTDP